MPTKCSICIHPARAAIDAALVSGVPLRTLEARHTGTKRSALDRHRKHIPAALTQAKQAAEVAEATTLLSRVEKLHAKCERLFDGAEQEGEWSGAAAAAREMRGCLELLGKLSGELKTGNVNAVQVNIGAGGDVANMTDADLLMGFQRFMVGMEWTPKAHTVNLFENETVAPPAGYEANNRYNEDKRKEVIQKGKPDPGWKP